jgi:hypothetical protein
VLNNAFDRSILSGSIPALEYDQNLMSVLDNVPLHFHELDLQLSKRCFVRRMAG